MASPKKPATSQTKSAAEAVRRLQRLEQHVRHLEESLAGTTTLLMAVFRETKVRSDLVLARFDHLIELHPQAPLSPSVLEAIRTAVLGLSRQ